MNKILTCFSVGASVFAISLSLDCKIYISIVCGLLSILLVLIGFKIELYIKANGNNLLNKIVYFFTPNDKLYNILSKHSIYTYFGCNDNGSNIYEFTKKYSILPMTNDLDRMNDRFSWSAPSNECVITATEKIIQ